MNAVETLEDSRRKTIERITEEVCIMLQPLCSRYDLSGSNRRMLYYNDPIFQRTVMHIAHLYLELEQLKQA